MSYIPHISVIIPTFNRPGDVRRALDSLTRVRYPSWDIMLVDQSEDQQTREVVDCYTAALPHLRYRHLRAKGTSRARNVGMEATNGEIIIFLDDDCTVEPDWLRHVVAVFERHPHAALGLAAVVPPPGISEWSSDGWTPSVFISEEAEIRPSGDLRNRMRLPRLLGMGACMFMRREVAGRVDRFDVHFGGGGRFHTFEDGDYQYRAYRAGFSIVRTPAVAVEHYGLRDYHSGAASRLLRTYHFGTGAWLMKALRLGDPFALFWLVEAYWRYLRVINLLAFFGGRGPRGMVRFVEYSRGLFASFQLGIDRRHEVYLARTSHL